MTIQQIISDILLKEKMTQYQLAKRIGVSKQAVSQLLKANDASFMRVLQILEALGYEFVIRKEKK